LGLPSRYFFTSIFSVTGSSPIFAASRAETGRRLSCYATARET